MMLILIDNKSGLPIYDQIFTQIKGHILSGELKTDEPLPSIRGLAKDLRISVITTKRAYDELEAAGFLYTVAGKGCFVAEKNLDLLREQQLREVEEYLSKAAEAGKRCGLGKDELKKLFSILLEEEA